MKIKVSELTSERQWRLATDFNQRRFHTWLSHFKRCYLETYGTALNSRQVESGINYCIQTEEELLLFTLLSLKSGLTYDLLGLVCGMDASNAKRNQTIGLDILGKTLNQLGHAPTRHFTEVKSFVAYFAGCKELIIDATEPRIQRPSPDEKQKQFYSGKRNHTPSSQ